MLSFLLLGAPRITRAQQPLRLTRRKNRALAFYLAASVEPRTRDHLLAFFFPDYARAVAQQILRTMLHDIRKELGAALVVQAEQITLAPDVFVDVREFERAQRHVADAANLAPLRAALELYRGDFLDDFSLPDTPTYDDWVAAERDRLRVLAARGWIKVAALHEQQRAYAQALDALERALAFDPLQESAQRAALRVQYRAGDRAGAIRRFEQFQKTLDDEMGVPPMPETRALYDAIITDALPRAETPPTNASPFTVANVAVAPLAPVESPNGAPLLPFVGRSAEWRAMQDAARAGKLIWLQGEPGIGKTRLAQEFIRAMSDQPLALRGTAYELESALPYQPWLEALRGGLAQIGYETLSQALPLAPVWRDELARLLPELDTPLTKAPPVEPLTGEARVWEAFHQMFRFLARKRRVVILLDEMHWADAATLGLLGYLAQRLDSDALTLLVTARPVASTTKAAILIQTLEHTKKIARLELDALSSDELAIIARKLYPARSDFLAQWLIEHTEGNPFFVNELVRYAYCETARAADGELDARVLSDAPLLTPTIQNLIASRLARLSENARRVITIAAVIGREFDFALAQRVAGLSEDDTLDALDALRASGLIIAAPGARLTFDHTLTLQATRQAMGAPRAKLLHRRVADALAEIHAARLEPVAGLIARHLVEAEEVERAAPYALRAGNLALSVAAWAEALAFFDLARRAENTPSARAECWYGTMLASFHSGAFAAASEAGKMARDLARAENNLDLYERALLALAQTYLPQARYQETIALGQTLREGGPSELELCAEFIWGVGLGVESAQPMEAEAHLRRAEELWRAQENVSDAYRSRITQSQIQYQLAGVLGQQGKFAQASALYLQTLALLKTDSNALDTLRTIMLYNNLAYYLHLQCDPRAAKYAAEGIALARAKSSLSHLPYLLSTSGEIALEQNDWAAAEKFFNEGLALAEQFALPERVAGLTANLGLVARGRGDMTLARAQFERALPLADALNARHLAARVRIWLASTLSKRKARAALDDARAIATAENYQGLLQEIELEDG